MGHEVEHGGLPCAHAERQKHVPDLADGGVCEDAFDIVLSQRAKSRRGAGCPRPQWPRQIAPPARAENKTCVRAMRYTPAVTIVAAWMSALVGVGPAIASGNQT